MKLNSIGDELKLCRESIEDELKNSHCNNLTPLDIFRLLNKEKLYNIKEIK